MLSALKRSRQLPASSLVSTSTTFQGFLSPLQSRRVSSPSGSNNTFHPTSSAVVVSAQSHLATPASSTSPLLLSATASSSARPTSSGLLGNSVTSTTSRANSTLAGSLGTLLPGQEASSSPSISSPASLDFDDPKSSFETRGTLELIRALMVFKASSYPTIVKHSRKLVHLSNKVLGETLTSFFLRNTFFAHFCAGEGENEVQRVVSKLKAQGVGSILDFAAEADLSEEKNMENVGQLYQEDGIQSRVYEYEGEEQCEGNLRIILSCIETTSKTSDGFSAIKMTALGKPELLEKMTTIIREMRALFLNFAEVLPSQDLEFDGGISLDQFKKGLKNRSIPLSDAQAEQVFNMIDADQSGFIEFSEWVEALQDPFLPSSPNFAPPPLLSTAPSVDWRLSLPLPRLSEKEKMQVKAMRRRLEKVGEKAQQGGVRVMVDAEQSYFQPAIDHMVLQMQRRFNQKSPVIYNTYQAYLRKSASQVKTDLERARREGFAFGAKIVRGAYMVQERRLALEKGYPDPICPTINNTHESYDNIVKMILSSPQKTEIMVATHNEESVRKTVQFMEELKLSSPSSSSSSNSKVFFGQLLGMCDYVSFSLGKQGYGVYKYLPYGPVKEVIPYLLRRAEENCDILGRTLKERVVLKKEIYRRLFG